MWMDGGISSDMAIITEDAVKRALTPAVPFAGYPSPFDNHDVWHGQMWMIYRQEEAPAPTMPIFGHGGSDGTIAIAFPDRNLIALYFTQSRGGTTTLGFEKLLRPLIEQSPPARASS